MSNLQWQPIATAPHDRMLLLRFSDGFCSMGMWDYDKYAKKPKPHFTYEKGYLYGKRYMRDVQPTEWIDPCDGET